MCDNCKELYIVISQTGTVISRILKFITGAEYNHASLCLNRDLKLMYSFGRKVPFFPLPSGFVEESPNFGTFKYFSNTKVLVLALKVECDQYSAIEKYINDMVTQKNTYGYNYLGLFLAGLKICHKSHNRYYCSEFIRDVLKLHNINGTEKIAGIVQPVHFLNLPDITRIYCGKLKNYGFQ